MTELPPLSCSQISQLNLKLDEVTINTAREVARLSKRQSEQALQLERARARAEAAEAAVGHIEYLKQSDLKRLTRDADAAEAKAAMLSAIAQRSIDVEQCRAKLAVDEQRRARVEADR